MKKIFNWTFGSVFRTFGRIIAYIIIGAIVSIILSNSDFRITDLFLDNVKASTTNTWVSSSDYSTNKGSTWTGTSVGNDNYYYVNTNLNGSRTYFFRFNNGPFTISQNGMMKFNIKFMVDTVFTQDITISQPNTTCTINSSYESPAPWGNIYDANWNITGKYEDIELRYNNFTCTGGTITGDLDEYPLSYSLTLGYYYNNNVDLRTPCYAVSNNGNTYTYECPITSSNINGIFVQLDTNQLIDFKLGYYYLFTKKTDESIDIIDNQNQNTQTIIQNDTNNTQQIIESQNQTQQTIISSTNQTISTITDNSSPDLNGTLDNNTIAGWLPAGPIDSIVTLPLTLLNSLFNAMGGTCADLTVPLPFIDSELSIPCMSKVYNSMSFSSFFNWIGIVASAFILYKYLLRLYKWIDATLTLRENTQVDWGGD